MGVDEKHISLSQYRLAVVRVDRPTLIVPFTRAEHVLVARLQNQLWDELQAEITPPILVCLHLVQLVAVPNFTEG